jgi:hypothetical protein
MFLWEVEVNEEVLQGEDRERVLCFSPSDLLGNLLPQREW